MSIAFDNRPSRSDIEPVALDLIRRRGTEVLGVARRYACSPEDAEDAYQRALEILLTKAPSTTEAELLPWLKTVVKHEAFALRKKRERDVPAQHDVLDAFAAGDLNAAEDRAERYDRLRVGAEALGRLKPQETTCLLLKAEGLSYQEIAARTGFTYTKVNRCLVEGRRAFVARVAGIESGAECERMAPLLSALADGEASAESMAALRPHLRGCSSCRATLREYREAPRKVAGLAAPLAAGGVLAWFGDKVASAVGWLKSLAGAAATQKAAVVAASSLAVAGGGAVTADAVRSDSQRAPGHAAPATAAEVGAQPRTFAASAAAVKQAGVRAATKRPEPGAAPVARPAAPSAQATTPARRNRPLRTKQPRAAVPRPAPPRAVEPAPGPATGDAGEFAP